MLNIVSESAKVTFSGSQSVGTGEPEFRLKQIAWGTLIFALLLCGFWLAAKRNPVGTLPYFPATFVCFSLMLGVMWYSGFGAASVLRNTLHSRGTRILLGSALSIPYLVSSIPAGDFHPKYLLAMIVLPVGLSALVGYKRLPQRLTWQDGLALAILAAALMTHSLSGAWAARGLGSLPKLYLTDVAIYAFLIVRGVENVGYSFLPRRTAFATGTREWLFFAPIGIGLGLALHFISFYPRVHSPVQGVATFGGIFLLIAVPEELFFRGILQNLLEPLVGQTRALLVASVFFGLSHFPKGALFNWRYVILATIAGFFYGRAWRTRRQLLASSITHAGVDTVWTLWFR